jgi:hypothetical protein
MARYFEERLQAGEVSFSLGGNFSRVFEILVLEKP